MASPRVPLRQHRRHPPVRARVGSRRTGTVARRREGDSKVSDRILLAAADAIILGAAVLAEDCARDPWWKRELGLTADRYAGRLGADVGGLLSAAIRDNWDRRR